MKRSVGSRNTPARLSETVHRQLSMYALAASAAGVGVLALSSPAQAEIVYTPAHVGLGFYYYLDLNHDGITDFTLYGQQFSHSFTAQGLLEVYSAPQSNAIAAKGASAMPLWPGSEIGPKRQFWRPLSAFVEEQVWHYHFGHSTTKFYGLWANGASGKGFKNRYLGLKFLINGKFHYGWARLDTTGGYPWVLTGYAYETIPNKPIIAGQTKGTFVGREEEDFGPGAFLTSPILDATHPASLGMLALGAQGVPSWRRKESAVEGG